MTGIRLYCAWHDRFCFKQIISFERMVFNNKFEIDYRDAFFIVTWDFHKFVYIPSSFDYFRSSIFVNGLRIDGQIIS